MDNHNMVRYWENRYTSLQKVSLFSTFIGTLLGCAMGSLITSETNEDKLPLTPKHTSVHNLDFDMNKKDSTNAYYNISSPLVISYDSK